MTIETEVSHSIFGEIYDVVDKDDITIVVPTLNEEKAIEHVIKDLLNEEFYNILVVDGYSHDNTVKIVKENGVSIISQHGVGKTGAVKTAIEHVKTPYMVIIDGDFTYSAHDINGFLPHITNYSEIIGTRKKGRENISKLNRFGNWLINQLFNVMFGTELTDVCSGLYALRTDFAKTLILNTKGFDVEVEIAAQASNDGGVTEVPITYGKRLGIQKLRPLQDGFSIITTILKLARIYNSMVFYSYLFSLSFIPSLFLLAWVAVEWLNGIWHSGWSLLGVLLMILASQAFTLGFVVSNQNRIEQRIINKLKE